jgi:signal transduction histidine kinase
MTAIQKETEKEDTVKSAFMSVVSHETQTPLATCIPGNS